MTTLFPPGYGGFPSYQFSSPNQINNRYYADGYRRRDMTFAPRYPTQPFYQPPFNPTVAYAAAQSYKDGRQGLGAQLVNAVNEMDYRYRQQQYQRKLAKIQRQYWNLQNNAIPPSPYQEPLPAPPLNYGRGTLFEYERETEFLPFPGYMHRGGGYYGGQTTLGYGQGWGAGFGATTTLPPKIRVIFVPTGHSYAQQPYTGPLAMPPFLYNRMAQPLSSCPPPPPLPQLGMLPLTPAVQQMVMQRYSNPVAVLPYSFNWQTPQMMMPSFYSPFQQQQQQQQPVSALQSFLPAPQPSMLPCMPAYPSAPSMPQPSLSFPAPAPMPAPFCSQLPPAPQSYIPPMMSTAPMQAYPQLPPAPQPFIAPPMQPAQYYSSLPPAPQTYIPSPNNIQGVSSAYAPPVTAANQYPSPLSSSQISSSYGTSSLSPSTSSDNSLSSYPSVCRACPPAPPPLTITVSGHCWVQHCAACHHVPTTDTNPNSRPTGGRCTPLLRYPTVPQYVPDQTQQYQTQYYTNTNAPVVSRPWLRKTPPLPPNCFILSDRHFNRDGTISQYPEPRREHRSRKHGSHSKRRSMTTAARAMPVGSPHAPTPSKSISPRRASKASRNSTGEKPAVKDQNVESQGSLSNSSSGLSTEYQKTTMFSSPVQKYPSPVQKENVPEPVAKEARNVNLQYSYQPQELPSVYNTNRYLRSGSESSGLSWSNRRSPNYSLSSSSDLQTVKSESRKPPRSSNHSKTYTEKLIIIREVVPDSPCSVSTISSNATFRIIDKDADSLSTTSTFEGNQLSGDEDLHSETL